MKTIVIYPGRYQPPHKGHKSVFDFLSNKKKPFESKFISSLYKLQSRLNGNTNKTLSRTDSSVSNPKSR
jgi:nicotinic acid mononucleotide adenylyltransferase